MKTKFHTYFAIINIKVILHIILYYKIRVSAQTALIDAHILLHYILSYIIQQLNEKIN